MGKNKNKSAARSADEPEVDKSAAAAAVKHMSKSKGSTFPWMASVLVLLARSASPSCLPAPRCQPCPACKTRHSSRRIELNSARAGGDGECENSRRSHQMIRVEVCAGSRPPHPTL